MEKLPITDSVTVISGLRNDIDTLINTAKNNFKPSREISLCHTHLQRSKMWLGKVLQNLKEANPYPDSSNPESKSIEPQAEHSSKTNYDGLPKDDDEHLARVKDFRSAIQTIISYCQCVAGGPLDIDGEKHKVDRARECGKISFDALEEAKMWLGWELDRIRNQVAQ